MKMTNYSIIRKSQLEGALRLDAEYYQPEYLEFSKNLLRIGEVPLGDLAFITDGQHGYHIVDPLSAIRHITAKNVVAWIVNDQDADRLAKETNDRNKRSVLEENDLLISTAGTTGEIGLVTKAILPANIDQDVARVQILDQKKLNPKFLVAFLNSKYGQFQLTRQTTGQIQTHISLDKIKNEVFVPVPDWQDKIAILVDDAVLNVENSKSFYSQAEDLLLEELGIKNWIPDRVGNDKGEIFSVVNLSEVQNNRRIDAEYYQAKYQKILALIRANKGMALGELVSLKKGFEPGSEAYQEEGKLFIRVSSLTKQGIIDKDQKYLNDKLYLEQKKDCEPKVGEILLTKDASPGIAYVVKESVEGVISGGIVRLKLREQNIEPEYVALCISSVLGQAQVERDAGGSVIMHWKPEQIKNLQIPILPKSTQEKIADLVKQSHEARKKAKELLERAKQKVEELIEKGI